MKSNFQRSLSLVLKHEGGWSDHPSDPGGATMKGVTLATYRRYKPGATKEQLRAIDASTLAFIYRAGYWNPIGGDTLAPGVDYAVFDFAVNSGPSRARSYLLKAVGGSDAETINRLCAARLKFLQGLKTWPTFGKGWTKRVHDVRQEALRMAAGSKAAPTPTKSAPTPRNAPSKPAVAKKAPAGVIGVILAVIGAGVLAVLKSKGVI
jgi:lysozyme family protein